MWVSAKRAVMAFDREGSCVAACVRVDAPDRREMYRDRYAATVIQLQVVYLR